MPCDHVGGPELIEMTTAHLRETGRSAAPGMRFRWAENLAESMWAAVIVEIERRGEQWIVTRLDRLRERVEESETGFREV